MKFTEFKNRKDFLSGKFVTMELDSLEKYHPDSNKVIALVRDSRSFQEKGMWHVYPIALTDSQVYVVCPYCGGVHVHGNSEGRYEGHRTAHCFKQQEETNTGYFIEKISEKKGGKTL